MFSLICNVVAVVLAVSGLVLLALGCTATAGALLTAAPTWTVIALATGGEADEDEE